MSEARLPVALIGLGATVNEYDAPFSPEPGAYGHDHTSHALLAR